MDDTCDGNKSGCQTSRIEEGDQVLLRLNEALKVVQVRPDKKIFFEKLHFQINNAIGCRYGSVFQVDRDQLSQINPNEDVDELRRAENGQLSSDYQAIKSDGQAQKLSRDDVESLKAQGITGKGIVDHLVENSATFQDRTEFSKAKYRTKKNKKHSARILIIKPTALLISEMFYSRTPHKICDLRPDALSQILALANIRAKSNVIVMEQCQGLVVGAILERMGGYGSITQIYSGDFPTRCAMECFNFPSSFMNTVNGFPLCKISKEQSKRHDQEETTVKMEIKTKPQEIAQVNPEVNMDDPPERNIKEEEKLARRNKRQREEDAARAFLKCRSLDGLVVVCKFHPSPIILALLEFVAPSRPFVIFSQFKEPLVECYNDLKNRGGVVNLHLTETWWRHYQVLPARSHPLVNMDGSGGFLLSGITVERNNKADSSSSVTAGSKLDTSMIATQSYDADGPPAKKPTLDTSMTDTQSDTDGPPAKKSREN